MPIYARTCLCGTCCPTGAACMVFTASALVLRIKSVPLALCLDTTHLPWAPKTREPPSTCQHSRGAADTAACCLHIASVYQTAPGYYLWFGLLPKVVWGSLGTMQIARSRSFDDPSSFGCWLCPPPPVTTSFTEYDQPAADQLCTAANRPGRKTRQAVRGGSYADDNGPSPVPDADVQRAGFGRFVHALDGDHCCSCPSYNQPHTGAPSSAAGIPGTHPGCAAVHVHVHHAVQDRAGHDAYAASRSYDIHQHGEPPAALRIGKLCAALI